jgi:hypothetical protein
MSLIDRILGTTVGKKMDAELQAITLTARKTLTAEAAALEVAGAAACAPLAVELSKCIAAVDAGKRTLYSAQAARNAAQSALDSRDRIRMSGIARIMGALEKDADPRITIFIDALQSELDGRRHSMSEQSPLYFAGLASAGKKAAALRYRAMDENELVAALAAIKAEIPSQFAPERSAAA